MCITHVSNAPHVSIAPHHVPHVPHTLHISHVSFGNFHVSMPVVCHILSFCRVDEHLKMSGVSRAFAPYNFEIERLWNNFLDNLHCAIAYSVCVPLCNHQISLPIIVHLSGFLKESEWTKIIMLNRSFASQKIALKRFLCYQFRDPAQSIVVHRQDHQNAVMTYIRSKPSFRIMTQISRLGVTFLSDPTILAQATKACYVELAEMLVESGVNVNRANRVYQGAIPPQIVSKTIINVISPLITAIDNRLSRLALRLIDAKADPNFRDIELHSEEHFNAIGRQICGRKNCGTYRKKILGHVGLFRSILPLNLAAARGELEIVSALIKAKADINACDELLMTPLLYATTNGHTSVVAALLTAGAGVDYMSMNNRTEWMYAKRQKRREIARMLAQAGATTNWLSLAQRIAWHSI